MKVSAILTRTNAIRLGGLILVSYIALLIGLGYLGQVHLRKSLLEQSRLTLEKQAALIHYLLNEQQDTIKELAGNPITNSFFSNRAMGMSMEYGLGTSLEMIHTELNRVLQRKKLFHQPIFSTIRFVDKDGTILVSTKTKDQQTINVPDIDDPDEILTQLFPNKKGGYNVRYVAGISYRHQLNGLIFADLNLSGVILPLLQHLGDKKNKNNVMLLGPKGRLLVSTRPAGAAPQASADHRIKISIPLGDSDYTLQGVIQQNQGMLLTSPLFLSAIALLSLPVLGGAFFLVHLNNNNLLLQAKYSVSQQQKLLTQQANQRVNAILSGIDAIVYVTDMETYRILYANATATALYGKLTEKICWQVLHNNQDGPCSFCPNDILLDDNDIPNPTQITEFQHKRNKKWFHCADCAIPWDDGRYVHLRVATDITDRIKNEQALQEAHKQLETIAYYDPLTRLANRRLFLDRLEQAFYLADRAKTGLAICYLDLDNFKEINDTYGHETGDGLLIQVSERLQENLRAEDTVARWGGDEFSLLLTGQNDENKCALTLSRLIDNLTKPYTIDTNVLQVTASIGVTLYPQDEGDPETLLRHADQAMYFAKQGGKKPVSFF
ncbi:MAG TPA: diguanylate cyclase [Desulfobulbus sp.]|nr:diguanylate cyclase [Desulfobulbus sp.]